MCCPVTAVQIGGRLHDHHLGALGDQKSFGSGEVDGGVPTILVLMSMQQTVGLIFVEEARDCVCCLSCLPARVFLRSGHILNLGDRRQGDGGREVSENHSCRRCCTSAELIMTTCQRIEFQAGSWGPYSSLSALMCGFLCDRSFGAT